MRGTLVYYRVLHAVMFVIAQLSSFRYYYKVQ